MKNSTGDSKGWGNMADTVFILGAGASFEAGAPLMSNFLDVADDLMYKGAVNRNLKSFKRSDPLIPENSLCRNNRT